MDASASGIVEGHSQGSRDSSFVGQRPTQRARMQLREITNGSLAIKPVIEHLVQQGRAGVIAAHSIANGAVLSEALINVPRWTGSLASNTWQRPMYKAKDSVEAADKFLFRIPRLRDPVHNFVNTVLLAQIDALRALEPLRKPLEDRWPELERLNGDTPKFQRSAEDEIRHWDMLEALEISATHRHLTDGYELSTLTEFPHALNDLQVQAIDLAYLAAAYMTGCEAFNVGVIDTNYWARVSAPTFGRYSNLRKREHNNVLMSGTGQYKPKALGPAFDDNSWLTHLPALTFDSNGFRSQLAEDRLHNRASTRYDGEYHGYCMGEAIDNPFGGTATAALFTVASEAANKLVWSKGLSLLDSLHPRIRDSLPFVDSVSSDLEGDRLPSSITQTLR
jgi:hypothetical protein